MPYLNITDIDWAEHYNVLVGYIFLARNIGPDEWPWPLRLVVMWFGYSTIVAPAALLIYYIRRQHEAGKFSPTSSLTRFLKQFALGYTNYTPLPVRHFTFLQNMSFSTGGPPKKKEEETNDFTSDCIWLTVDAGGIMATMLMMGWLQERIITQEYEVIGNPEQKDSFEDMQFLVFCNRVVALVVSLIVLTFTRRSQPPHVPPYYVHSYTSFANTMSSWCQYEALKFVSFPTQTICKVSKVVATMLMGKVVRSQSYKWSEYATAAGIATGAGMFLLNTGEHGHISTTTSISGFVLMAGYLVFDSFTLNWQKVIFDTKPKVSKNQMMFGVNAFSVILTLVSLIEQGTLWSSLNFALTHDSFLLHNFLMSLCSAIGQLFIYATIERFGPIVFAVIMTVRQMGSILLSTISYSHPMTIWSGLGLLVAFSSMFIDIYRRYFEKKRTRETPNTA